MKQSLNLRQTQRLTMTPQLQQAIRLLQMSNLELKEEIHLAQQDNPLLEVNETEELPASEPGATEPEAEQGAATNEHEGDMDYGLEQVILDSTVPARVSWDELQSYLPIDERRSTSGFATPGESGMQAAVAEDSALTLKQHLLNQIGFLVVDIEHLRAAHYIIENINDAGYLEAPLEEIVGNQQERPAVGLAVFERVLDMVQSLEPVGVGARNARECLMIQLNTLQQKAPPDVMEGARRIVDRHLHELATKDFAALRRCTGIRDDGLAAAVKLIQSLNPHPGYSVGDAEVRYLVPDIVVEKKSGHWFARLNPDALPRVAINRDYQSLVSENTGSEYATLREQLQNARWLLANIEKRHETILAVAQEIVERQQPFFNEGVKALRPMTLADIAKPLGVHESTVSRATANKYLFAPSGMHELKYFFSPGLVSETGEAVSALAMQSEIAQIVQAESPKKPMSDEKISRMLAESGFRVARRTVAKYREQLHIPAASKRKSLTE